MKNPTITNIPSWLGCFACASCTTCLFTVAAVGHLAAVSILG